MITLKNLFGQLNHDTVSVNVKQTHTNKYHGMNETWKTKYEIKHVSICPILFLAVHYEVITISFYSSPIVQDTHTRHVKSHNTTIVFKAD